MQITINGKRIKITESGYLYINGIKQSMLRVSPLANLNDITTDHDALELCRKYNAKYYVMCNLPN